MLNDLSHSKGPVRPRFLQIRVKGTLKSQGSTKVRSGNGQNCIRSMRGNEGSNYYRVLKGNQVSNGCFTISWEVFLYYRNDWVVIKLGCIRSSFKRLRASVQYSQQACLSSTTIHSFHSTNIKYMLQANYHSWH